MNFGFTEEQELLRKTARDFLAEHAGMKRVRGGMEDERDSTPANWADADRNDRPRSVFAGAGPRHANEHFRSPHFIGQSIAGRRPIAAASD